MFSSSFFFFCQFYRQEMEFQRWNICNVMPAKQKRKKQQMPAVSLSFNVRNSGLCVRQTLRFCRPSSSDSSRPASYRKRKKMPASWFQSRFSRSQENRRLHICGFRRKYVTSPASLASYQYHPWLLNSLCL